MSYLWWKPACDALKKKIELELQQEVHPDLDPSKVYAKHIVEDVEELFRTYENKWIGFCLVLLPLYLVLGGVIGYLIGAR